MPAGRQDVIAIDFTHYFPLLYRKISTHGQAGRNHTSSSAAFANFAAPRPFPDIARVKRAWRGCKPSRAIHVSVRLGNRGVAFLYL
jgi:hypothetical protein